MKKLTIAKNISWFLLGLNFATFYHRLDAQSLVTVLFTGGFIGMLYLLLV